VAFSQRAEVAGHERLQKFENWDKSRQLTLQILVIDHWVAKHELLAD
jgi:hypothetical protein